MKRIALCLVMTSFCLSSLALELKGVTMGDEQVVNGKKLLLNGMGLREVDILNIYIKVYVGGLYLEKKTNNGDEIISSKGTKQMRMQFLRHVSSDDEKKSWEKGIMNNCGDKCALAKENLSTLKSILTKVDEGDVMIYTFDDKGVTLDLKGQRLGAIPNLDFSKMMLATWVGPKPATLDLKNGLLGTK